MLSAEERSNLAAYALDVFEKTTCDFDSRQGQRQQAGKSVSLYQAYYNNLDQFRTLQTLAKM